MLHQIPHVQMIGAGNSGHRVQAHIFPAPLHHLVVLVFHPAQSRRLLLSQGMALPQFSESLPEEFGRGKVIRHLCKVRILRPREHRSIKYPCSELSYRLNSCSV
jgi:hypothetical protein